MEFTEIMYIVGTILILPAILFAMYAQARVHSAFNRYSEIPSARGMTAAQLAKKLLQENGCTHVTVERVSGHLSDHYDPKTKTVRLSTDVHDSTSLAALGIAAHEVGHAIQDHTNYAPLKLRQIIIRTTNLINKFLLPLVIIGLIASLLAGGAIIFGIDGSLFFLYLMLVFCAMYGISFIVNVITLPTEYNASARAKRLLREGNLLANEDESEGVSRVLNAAALTYVAGLMVSFAYFLRFLAIVLMLTGNRKN